MDRFEKIWDEIKENCKGKRLELFLMLLFVIAAVGLSVDDLAAVQAVSGTAVEPESETGSGPGEAAAETDFGTETEWNGEERETETSENGLEEDTGRTVEDAAEEETDPAAEEIFSWPLEYYTLRDMKQLHGYKLPPLPEKSAEPGLKDILRKSLAEYDGDWSVYAKNLATGEEVVVNDRPMKSASVMKLFIMGAVYKAFESGEMERTDEVMSLMNDMITYSDNPDSNRLLYYLGDSSYARGIEKVNEFIDEYGFSSMTVEYNGFNDPETNTRSDVYNQVTARDCGRLLEAVYRRELVNRKVSNEIEQMMLNQDTRYKIPAGLPEGVSCGNKSGEMDTTENDAAIVYGNACDYILVVLSSDWNSKDEAISRISSVSSQVYEYFER